MTGDTACILFQGQKLWRAPQQSCNTRLVWRTWTFHQTRRTLNISTLTHQYASHFTLRIFSF